MQRSIRLSSLLATAALMLGALVLVAPAATADNYVPSPGVRINNPQGSWASRNRINQHIVRSIYSVPKGGYIRIMSWNVLSHRVAQALVNVHKYNQVSVQIIMDYDNAFKHVPDPDNPIAAPGDGNPDWWWMTSEFQKYGNSTRPAPQKSWTKLCHSSCRGGSGLPHIKMYLFSQVTNEPHVLMWSSGNLTEAAANIQWNDMYTTVNNLPLFNLALKTFIEARRDQPIAGPYRYVQNAGIGLSFFPFAGTGAGGYPVVRALAPVHCSGADAGWGTSHHHTIIRMAQTAINDAYGVAVAYRLKQLWNQGCDVKVLYTIMGHRPRSILRSTSGRGPVPIHQLAKDTDGDLVYDRYLHMKVLTVNGVYGSDTSATRVWNGSANIAGYTLASDEVFAWVSYAPSVSFYQNWISGMMYHAARYARSTGGDADDTRGNVDEAKARKLGINPYAKVQIG